MILGLDISLFWGKLFGQYLDFDGLDRPMLVNRYLPVACLPLGMGRQINRNPAISTEIL